MEKNRFRCLSCGKLRMIRKKGQMYCSDKRCQQCRKNNWRRKKYQEDPDYRLNQRDSTKAWLVSQGGGARYYREYRKRKKRHRKKLAQAVSNHGASMEQLSLFAKNSISANRDAREGNSLLKSGTYMIFPISGRCGANRDAIGAKIEIILDRYP